MKEMGEYSLGIQQIPVFDWLMHLQASLSADLKYPIGRIKNITFHLFFILFI